MNIKNFKFRQILFFFVILGVFFAFSCDDKTDLNNIASEIEIGGSASLPLIKESEFSMYDLLKSYGDVSVVPGMSLDTLDGDILLIYSDTFQYAMPSINKLFGTFNADMEGIGIAHLLDENQTLLELLKIQPQTLPYAQKLYDDDWEDEYDLNEEDNIEDEIRDRQLLTKILFENTTINVTVDPNFEIRNEGVLVMEVELPGIDGDSIHLKNINVTSKKTFSFPQNKFYFNASGKIKTHVVLTGDGETRIDENSRIDISVSFVPTNENYRYACYGLFNYILDDVANFNIEDYKADLHDYIPKGSALHFEDPKFEFAAISNLGLDLEFHMDTVQSFIDEKGIKSINPTQTRQATVKRAGKLDEKTTTSDLFKMDKDYFNRNGAEISDFFTTDLDSMNFVYHLSTASEKKVPKEELIIGDKFKEEFIPSDGQLTVYGKMTIPMSFDTGSVLCYSDTIEFDF
ncbi:MAG: hypothetical protein LBH32_09530, partial [Dysgonamonadaceae bacterium]|nr:hypothetical protein [Dysgonamonadaceae bacterium]